MSKEFETLETSASIVEISTKEVKTLDDLSLALIGGGEAAICV